MSGRLVQMSGVVVDLVYFVETLPASGGEAESSRAFVAAGGGFNAMIAAKRSGADVAYGGALGSGIFAEIATRAIEAERIAILQRQRKADDQGNCVVLVEPAGERSFVSHHGAERHIETSDIEPIHPRDDDWVLVTGYGLNHPRSTAALTSWLNRLPRGPRVFFDPGPMAAHIPAPALAAVLERADWVSANRREAEALTGHVEPARSAQSLAQGRAGALVRDGEAGCWLAAPNLETEHIPGFAVDAVDTTGAGDAHDGAFIAASLSGLAPCAAAVFANAAAALSTTAPGPATAPDLADVRAFLAARRAGTRATFEVRSPIVQPEAKLRDRV